MLHIIHLKHRTDRMELLNQQLREQNVVGYRLWENDLDEENPKRGIARAHKQIVRWAQEKNLASVVIAEDDVKFAEKGAYDYFRGAEPDEYDLYLGGISYGKIGLDNSVSDFSGMHLYKISQRFYPAFLSLPEEMDIDRSLAGKGKFIVANPFVAIQQDGYSDNQKRYQTFTDFLK